MRAEAILNETMCHIGATELRDYATRVFEAVGLSGDHAACVADNLVLADLRGIDSHGVTRIPIYAERLQRGVVNATPALRAEHEGGPLVVVDGDNGPGAVVGRYAVDLAIEAARKHGIGAALAHSSNHFGICAYYALRATEQNCLAIVMTNSPPSMAVHGSAEPGVGTNPFAFAAPVQGRKPVVLDFASSVVARGKIVEKAKKGEPIPEGWALDKAGRPTTSAKAAEEGTVLPFAGPKGSGLGLLVDILCGVLTGAAFGPLISNLYNDFENPQNIGHFFLVIDPGAVATDGEFEKRNAQFAAHIKSLRAAAGFAEILLPGEPEDRFADRHAAQGIPLSVTTMQALRDFSRPLGIPFPLDK